jgi:HEAT repeat protein
MADSLTRLLALHVTAPVPPLRSRAPDTPPALVQIVLRMLAKDPAARFASLREVEQALAGQVAALQEGPGRRFFRRRRWAAVAGGLAALLLGLVGLFGLGGARYLGWRPPSRGVATERLQALRAQAVAVLRGDARGAPGELRLQALLRLGASRDVSLRPVLEEVLTSASGEVQAAAAEALGQLGSRKARPALRGVLAGDPSLPARVAAAGALDRLGDPLGHDELVRLLREGEPDAQLRAAVLLCQSGDTEAQGVLRARLLRSELPDEVAIGLLGRLAQAGDEAAQTELGRRMAAGPLALQLRAAEQLAVLGDARARGLLREHAEKGGPAQLLALRTLASLGDNVDLGPLRQVLAAPESAAVSTGARIDALLGLGAGGQPEDAEALGRLLVASTAPPVRQAAAAALLLLAARDPLILAQQTLSWAQGASGDESWLLREAAVAALSDLSSPGAAGEAASAAAGLLRRLFAEDRDARVRRRAARALSTQLERASIEALHAGLRDEAAEVREESLRALGRIARALAERHDTRLLSLVTGWLSEATSAGPPREQILARGMLLSLGDEGQRGGLQAFYKSKDAELRELALDQLGDDRELLAGLLGDDSAAVRLAAARRLAGLGDRRGVPVLEAAQQRPGRDGVLAFVMLRRLGVVRDDPERLEQLLREGSASERIAAVEALGQLPSGLALPLLEVAARDPEPLVRRMTAEVAADLALGPEGSPALPLLRRLAGDRDAVVRVRAAVLLQRAQLQRPTSGERPDGGTAAPAVASSAGAHRPPLPAPPAAPPAGYEPPSEAGSDEAPGVPPTGTAPPGSLVLEADPLLLVQLDERAWQPVARGPVALPPGRHTLRYPGGERTFEIESGQTLKLGLPLPPPAQLCKAGVEALAHKSYAKAQRLLTKAQGLCSQQRARGCGPLGVQLSFYLGRAFEEQSQWAEAMTAYQRVAKATGRLHAEQRAAALEATVRLLPRVGRLLVRKPQKGRCQEVELWMPPGLQSIDLDGKPTQVRMRARETAVIDACGKDGGGR